MDRIDNIVQETVYKNENLNNIQKERIEFVVKYICNFVNDKFDVDVELENAAALLSTVKESVNYEENYSNRAYIYDLNTNSIVDNTRFVKNDSRGVYDYTNAIMDIITKKYNPDFGKYDDGLSISLDGNNKFGTKINEKLKHTLLTHMTCEALEEEDLMDSYIDKPGDPCNLEDSLLMDINSLISAKDLVSCLINCEGNLFFEKISKLIFEDNDKTIDFFFNIDSYCRENSIKNRIRYEEYMNIMKENCLEILDEHTNKVA